MARTNDADMLMEDDLARAFLDDAEPAPVIDRNE